MVAAWRRVGSWVGGVSVVVLIVLFGWFLVVGVLLWWLLGVMALLVCLLLFVGP